MKTLWSMLVAAVLVLGSGCAKPDWIERTLVTVDVTGTWYGRAGLEVELKLLQEGPKVAGFVRVRAGSNIESGQINGTVSGDVFTFRQSDGSAEGEFSVRGDEMTGALTASRVTVSMTAPKGDIVLRRVGGASHPTPKE